MLTQQKLVKALQAEILACRTAKPREALDRQERDKELRVLTTHLHWVMRVADDPTELERIVKSLEIAKRRIRFH